MKTITNTKALEYLENGAEWLGLITLGSKMYLFLRIGVAGESSYLFRTEV